MRSYGRLIEALGERKINNVAGKWDFTNEKYNSDYLKNGVSLAKEGINNIKSGFSGAFNSIKNIGNPNGIRYRSRTKISDYGNESDRI